MFNIIDIYNANNMYSMNSTINTTSLSIAKAMKSSGNTSDCLFSFSMFYIIQLNLTKHKQIVNFFHNIFYLAGLF